MKTRTKEHLATLGGAVLGAAAVSCCFIFSGAKTHALSSPTMHLSEISQRAMAAVGIDAGLASKGTEGADPIAQGDGDNPLDPSESGVWAVSREGEARPVSDKLQAQGPVPELPAAAATLIVPTNREMSVALQEKGERGHSAIARVAVVGETGVSWADQGNEASGEEATGLILRLKDGEKRSILIFLDGVKKPLVVSAEGRASENSRRHKDFTLDIQRVSSGEKLGERKGGLAQAGV